jgi:tRNA A37 N6-isopentenylltransferase MiaA
MNKIAAIYGPTTSNKLGLALNLAKYVWGKYQLEPEVVNVDSRKIYQGFIVSQSLPTDIFLQKVKTHLFGTVSPKNKLDLYEFQKLVLEKIAEIQARGNLPILIGSSTIHLLAILQEWEKDKKRIFKKLPDNILVLGLTVNKPSLKKAVKDNVVRMFRNGLYEEFKNLYQQSQKGEVSLKLLEETLGYRQFIEMAKVSEKSPENLNKKDLIKIKAWLIKDIINYAYHQTLGYKKFSGIKFVKDFKEARRIIDLFILPQKSGLRKQKD